MLDFIAQLFTDLNTFDSFMVLFFLLGSFLIGLFTGRSMSNKKRKLLEKTMKQQESDLISIRGERDTLLQRVKKQEQELEGLTGRLVKAKAQLTETQKDRDQYQSEWQNSQKQINTLEHNNQAYQSHVLSLEADHKEAQAAQVRLQAEVQNLERTYQQNVAEKKQLAEEKEQWLIQRDQLQAEKEELTKAVEAKKAVQTAQDSREEELTNSRISMIESRVERLTSENERLRETILTFSENQKETPASNLVDMDSINQRLAQLEAENQQLKLNVAALQDLEEEVEVDFEEGIAEEEVEEIEIDMDLEEVVEAESAEEYNFISTREKSEIAKGKLKKALGQRIPIAIAENKDQLQLINGIGPFIEEQLNSVGIFTFEQISNFDDELIHIVTEAIQFFPGRIKRDDWKGQAARHLLNLV